MPRHAPVVLPAHPGAPPASDLDKYQTQLRVAPGISAASNAQYCTQLARLTQTVGHGVEWMLGHPDEAEALLLSAKRTDGLEMIEAPMTLKALLDSLIALLKHSTELKENIFTLGVKDITSVNDRYKVSAYPNPFGDVIAFSIVSDQGPKNYTIMISDLMGRDVYSREVTDAFVIGRAGLTQGIYIYKITSGDQLIGTGKIIAR